jgi:hypothetical protein
MSNVLHLPQRRKKMNAFKFAAYPSNDLVAAGVTVLASA